VQGDVLLGGGEQLGHFQLGEPHGLAVGAQLDATGAILGGVEDQAAHALTVSGAGNNCCIRPCLWVLRAVSRLASAAIWVGIFPAVVLAEFERQFLNGASAVTCFDMIAGTSTGGIIALGLASGLTAAQIATVYVERGNIIFPPAPDHWFGRWAARWQWFRNLLKHRYDREPIRRLLTEVLGDRNLSQARTRLCIPSFEGTYGDVYIYGSSWRRVGDSRAVIAV